MTLEELRPALLRSLRTRYTLLVVLPLLLIALLSVAAEQIGLSSLVLTQRRLEVQNDAMAHAGQYDAYFLEAERAAEMLASILSKEERPNPEELYRLLEATLHANPNFYGSAIAYVPYGFEPGRRLFAPYVMRRPDRIERMDIGAAGYDYSDGRWEWWSGPAKSLRRHWTQPYDDTGAGQVRMATCSVPFFRNGKLEGVATIDLELTALRQRVEEHRGPSQGTFLIVTSTGNLVFGGDGNLVDEARKTGRADQMDYALKLTNREGPRTMILDTPQGAEVASFVPLSGPDWSFGSQVSEADLMATDHSRVIRSALALGIMVVGAAAVVWIVLGWMTGGLTRLREEMEDFCRGKLPRRFPEDTRDELGDLQRAFFTVTELLQDQQTLRETSPPAEPAPEETVWLSGEVEIAGKKGYKIVIKAEP